MSMMKKIGHKKFLCLVTFFLICLVFAIFDSWLIVNLSLLGFARAFLFFGGIAWGTWVGVHFMEDCLND